MAESLLLPQIGKREEIYASLLPQLAALTKDETDLTANLANIAAVLKEAFGFFWVGFYRQHEGQLVLGPFQGPVACTRIAFDRGVCGAAYTRQQTLLVPDIALFPDHIACSSVSRSEVVVPVLDGKGGVAMVLDVDSDRLDDFTQADVVELEAVGQLITTLL